MCYPEECSIDNRQIYIYLRNDKPLTISPAYGRMLRSRWALQQHLRLGVDPYSRAKVSQFFQHDQEAAGIDEGIGIIVAGDELFEVKQVETGIAFFQQAQFFAIVA